MNVSLSGELEQFIDDRVKSGKYSSGDEVIEKALQLLRDRKITQKERLAELKEKIGIGIEELDRGEGIDGEEVFAELEEDVRQIEAEMQQVDRSTVPGKTKGKLKSRSQLRRSQPIAATSSLETLQTLRSEARY